MRWVLALGLVTGCVQSSDVECGDGRTCPGDRVCDDTHHLCVFEEQLAACAGKATLDACSAKGATDGACFDAVCLQAGCGNGFVERDEACDDGNNASADGCSADCKSNETCGNGVVDPQTGESCDDGNDVQLDGCHNDCHVPVCGDGVKDTQYNEGCDDGAANSLAVDAACRPNCQPRSCGDGVEDAASGEVCDDGNLEAGDGCTPDCLSEEVCGNDYLDFATTEQCDEGDLIEHDGCSSMCKFEGPEWRRHEQGAAAPVARAEPAIAYDPVRDRVVLFGGGHPVSGGGDGTTWELVENVWVRRYPERSPPQASGAQMAYDLARKQMVLFGGAGNTDTWLYDGTTWTLAPKIGPQPASRTAHVMAYDVRRKRVVMTGGGIASGYGDDPYALVNDGTWEWDGTQWHQFAATIGARVGAAAAYDPVGGGVVIYGGGATSDETGGELYRWTGSGYDDISVSGPALSGASIAFDTASGKVLLIGGVGNTTTYRLDATQWTAIGGTALPARGFFGAVSRGARGDVIVFGGCNAYIELIPSVQYNDTWRHDASGWASYAATVALPPGHTEGSIAYDSDRGVTVAFGGMTGNFTMVPNSTYLHRNDVWTTISPAGSPGPRRGAAMVYDAARRKTVLFGGASGDFQAMYRETWLFDGATGTWSHPTPANEPTARRYAGVAYDSARGRVVLFGGYVSTQTLATEDDTWEWDGTNWIGPLRPTTRPSARGLVAMAYDPRRQRTVMYGGGTNETWEWDGANWMKKSPATTPYASSYTAMAYDAARGRIILFGGNGPLSYSDDTWEYDGTDWSHVDVLNTPPARGRHQLTFEAAEHRMLITGGNASVVGESDTWTFHYAAGGEGASEACNGLDGDGDGLVGCADADCWAVCDPHCPPGTTCNEDRPRCGDGTCSALESKRLCPGDCGAPTVMCGDWVCDASESSCPGDCAD